MKLKDIPEDQGVTCAECKSILFSIKALILHREQFPTHRVYTFGGQIPIGAFVIKLLLDIELESE